MGGSGSSSSVKMLISGASSGNSGVKMRGSGASRARGARAWKCRSPERTVGRVWLAFLQAAIPGAPRQSEKCTSPERARVARAWKCGAPERAREARLSKSAVGSEMSKIMVSGTAKTVKWWCSGAEYFKICENDMLRNGNLGLKMGVSRAAHTQYGSSPPPPGSRVSTWRNFNLLKMSLYTPVNAT